MLANVYVDGFNLYYSAVAHTDLKWLDLSALCARVFPQHQINRIRYFTARVRGTPDDPKKADRQQVYIRALKAIPRLSVHYGHFVRWPKWMPPACASLSGQRLPPLCYQLTSVPLHRGDLPVQVFRTEEKGSDVNLASYLLLDAFRGDYETAIVLSNDSDLTTPIRLVSSELGFPVSVLSPARGRKYFSKELERVASFYIQIRRSDLADCQFPPIVHEPRTGSIISRPPEWASGWEN